MQLKEQQTAFKRTRWDQDSKAAGKTLEGRLLLRPTEAVTAKHQTADFVSQFISQITRWRLQLFFIMCMGAAVSSRGRNAHSLKREERRGGIEPSIEPAK